MTEKSKAAAPHAYEPLTPDLVLDALASVGLAGDGRLMALSSYENRVYQVHLESPVGSDELAGDCLLYTSPSPRDGLLSRMPSSA